MPALRTVHYRDLTEDEHRILFNRAQALDAIVPVVREIMEAVQAEGDAALLRYTARLDGATLEQIAVSDEEFLRAEQQLDSNVWRALEVEIASVRTFHRTQLSDEEPVETAPGVRVWREWRPIERVGLYVPGGRGPYPSSVVMLGVPASLAGCPQVILCTPPGPDGRVPDATLVAARLVGIHTVFKLGGAQAIAAMAYGTASVPRVDKVFGAGNAYVTAAKLLAFPQTAMDVPAGPSELLIIADDSADPSSIAADLLSDAEHGPDSSAVLITTSTGLAQAVADEIELQLGTLPRREVAESALRSRGLSVVVDTLEEAATISNLYAPEHLEIVTRRPRDVLALIHHAGSIFLGPYAPNAAGDYATGTNHVLPTAGYARTHGPVSVESFGRLVQCQEVSHRGLASLHDTISTLAREEGLEGHARAVEIRFREDSA